MPGARPLESRVCRYQANDRKPRAPPRPRAKHEVVAEQCFMPTTFVAANVKLQGASPRASGRALSLFYTSFRCKQNPVAASNEDYGVKQVL